VNLGSGTPDWELPQSMCLALATGTIASRTGLPTVAEAIDRGTGNEAPKLAADVVVNPNHGNRSGRQPASPARRAKEADNCDADSSVHSGRQFC